MALGATVGALNCDNVVDQASVANSDLFCNTSIVYGSNCIMELEL